MQLLSQSPMWYENPGHLRIKLEPDEVRISPMDHDAVINKKIDGKTLKALVPTHTLGENRGSVPVSVARKQGDKVVLHLPTSSEGRATWVMQESQFNALLVEPD